MARDKNDEELIETILYRFGVQKSGEIAKAIIDALTEGKHNWITSRLGHGNFQCTKCKITDLEAKAIGKYEVCDA